jgi:putative protease
MAPGDRVYKITDKELKRRARASFEGKSGTAEKAMRKMGVSCFFSAGLYRPVSLKAVDEEGNSVTKELPKGAEKAVNRPVTAEAVTAQLSKTGGTPFRVVDCTADVEEGISIPLSRINELRRSVLEELETLHRRGNRKPVTIHWSLPAKQPVPKAFGEETGLYLYRVKGDERFSKAYSRIYVPYDAVLKGFYHGDDRIMPVIPNITKGWHDHNIRENFDKLVEVSAQNGIAVGNLGWIEPFANAGVNVFGGQRPLHYVRP